MIIFSPNEYLLNFLVQYYQFVCSQDGILSAVLIPPMVKKQLVLFVKRIYVVDADIPVNELSKNDEKLEKVLLGREFHISLGKTVPIGVH
ncbi:hypothetical protein J5N97_013448 [Dioscorea zingiberensis]|uniref:Uncharacterized protein n=1 Tax=Dioscorea zingiberensis TaxID=325984 RepID=A0A9D5HIT0_9LILI|nr:hypothetical protein J5N97_013448 [Dioscorea zingiberensis]